MKIPIFHNNGKEINNFKCQVFVENLASYPIDSKAGLGYGVQLNLGNPNIMLDINKLEWIPIIENNLSYPRAFQQSMLQIGFKSPNDHAMWNLNADLMMDKGTVDYSIQSISSYVYDHLCNYGKGQFQCIEFEILKDVMSIKIIDMFNGGILYSNREYLKRFNYNTWLYDKVPIAPFTFFQVRVVGIYELSHATFPTDTNFTVTMHPNSQLKMNVLDTEKDIYYNMNELIIDNKNISHLLTGESSNLTSIVDKEAFNNSIGNITDNVPSFSYTMRI